MCHPVATACALADVMAACATIFQFFKGVHIVSYIPSLSSWTFFLKFGFSFNCIIPVMLGSLCAGISMQFPSNRKFKGIFVYTVLESCLSRLLFSNASAYSYNVSFLLRGLSSCASCTLLLCCVYVISYDIRYSTTLNIFLVSAQIIMFSLVCLLISLPYLLFVGVVIFFHIYDISFITQICFGHSLLCCTISVLAVKNMLCILRVFFVIADTSYMFLESNWLQSACLPNI